MEDFVQSALLQLLPYKYAALFGVTFLSAFALPLPSTTSLVAAAGFASQGHLHIGLVILWAVLGNVIADNLSYWAARFFGVSIFRFKITKSSVFHFMEAHLKRHSELIIFWSRFQVIPTITVNILSGIIRSDYRKFFLYSLLGETMQVLLFAGIGYFSGDSLAAVIPVLGNYVFIVLAGMLLVLMLFRRGLKAYVDKRSHIS